MLQCKTPSKTARLRVNIHHARSLSAPLSKKNSCSICGLAHCPCPPSRCANGRAGTHLGPANVSLYTLEELRQISQLLDAGCAFLWQATVFIYKVSVLFVVIRRAAWQGDRLLFRRGGRRRASVEHCGRVQRARQGGARSEEAIQQQADRLVVVQPLDAVAVRPYAGQSVGVVVDRIDPGLCSRQIRFRTAKRLIIAFRRQIFFLLLLLLF